MKISKGLNVKGWLRTGACAMGLALGTLSFANSVEAQTLDAIKSRKRVIIGVQAENPNWGFLNSQGEYQGIDPDVARLLGKELGLPVEFVPVTNNNRFAALQTGRVDVLIASVGMLPERSKSVQFSHPYAPNETIVVAAKSTPATSMSDLGKMTVGVPRGAIMDTQLTQRAPSGTNILRFDDDSANLQALLSGQVQALGANLFYVSRLNEQKHGVFEKKFVLAALYQGAASRLGDKTWNAYLNAFVEKNKNNGALAAIYKKWTGLEMSELPKSIEGVPFTAE
jgi:polar amino acid transport system substrate-binding protein